MPDNIISVDDGYYLKRMGPLGTTENLYLWGTEGVKAVFLYMQHLWDPFDVNVHVHLW